MKKLLPALNKLMFIKDRTEKEVFDIQSLSLEIQKDFIESTRLLAYWDNYAIHFAKLPKPKYQTAIENAMWIPERCVRPGNGFTPKLAIIGDKKTGGYNCLGRAITLGAYLKCCKGDFEVYLGITPDHSLVILKSRKSLYVCDTHTMQLKKLHGKIIQEKGYEWYTKSKDDEILFNHIIIQDFNKGIVNAIIQSFLFLEENQIEDVSDFEKDCMAFKDQRFNLRTVIHQTPWKKIQNQYFSDLNQYHSKYSKEYLIESLRIQLERQKQSLSVRFNKAVKTAFQYTFHTEYTPEKNKKFIEQYIPFMKSVHEKIILFISEKIVKIDMPSQLDSYLKLLRKECVQDPALKEFTIGTFKKILLT